MESRNISLLLLILKQPKINIEAETYGNHTPVILAHGRNYDDIVDILANHGANTSMLPKMISNEEDMVCMIANGALQ